MAFKHHISFATNLTVNFGCYEFRIIPELPSEVAVLFNSNLSRPPFLRQVIDLVLLLGPLAWQHVDLFLICLALFYACPQGEQSNENCFSKLSLLEVLTESIKTPVLLRKKVHVRQELRQKQLCEGYIENPITCTVFSVRFFSGDLRVILTCWS